MSEYITEEEQLENIKKWWQRYGTYVTVCVSVVLLSIAGFRYYQWHDYKIKQQSSVAYERMMVAYANHNGKALRSYANDLIKNYSNSIYADAAHMTLAKVYANKDKLDKAKSELELVVAHTKMPALKQIAKIRIARLMAADKAYSNALNELSTVEDPTYLPVINELKGDIYGANGQFDEAIKAYKLAIDAVRANGMGNLFLEMKSNELSNKTQSMVADEKLILPS